MLFHSGTCKQFDVQTAVGFRDKAFPWQIYQVSDPEVHAMQVMHIEGNGF